MGWVGLVGLAENIATQPSLAGAWLSLAISILVNSVLVSRFYYIITRTNMLGQLAEDK